jgi:hypothetical protein
MPPFVVLFAQNRSIFAPIFFLACQFGRPVSSPIANAAGV